MNKWMYAYLAIGLLLFAAPAGALVPDNITIGTDRVWVTAGNPEPATLTVQVVNSTSGSTLFEGVAVNLAVNETYGSISPIQVVTNKDGKATAVFTPGTHSGNVTITATATYTVGEETVPLIGSVDQQVDHAAPAAVASLWYDPEVTVGGKTEIVVRMVDRYKNVVDSRREAENVRFTVGSPSGSAAFVNGTDNITASVNETGKATATLHVDKMAGENLILIQPPTSVKSEYISILSVANGTPFNITCAVEPRDASVPASGDENDTVQLTYTLTDRYGNPVGSQDVTIVTDCADDKPCTLKTSPFGLVRITYGPKKSAGVITITATTLNESVTNSTVVEFTSTDPEDMLLTASPQTMASNDTNTLGVTSAIQAKVFDVSGNPVEDELVSFMITRVWYDDDAVKEEDPVLKNSAGTTTGVMGSPISATTGKNGYAVIQFIPGSFPDPAPGTQRVAATGHAEVKATWINQSGFSIERPLTLTWKNYPYLTVKTSVNPERVNVTDTVDVTIQLKGDGWALEPDPIDVVLCTDRSWSMFYDNPDRMVKAMEAAMIFSTKMDYQSGQPDRLGIVSFGGKGQANRVTNGWLGDDNTARDDWLYTGNYSNNKYYADYAVLDLELGNNPSTINTTIKGMIPYMWTPMRYGVFQAINELKDHGREGAIKAVIVLSDGDYNYYGDPLARGTAHTPETNPSYFDDDLTKDYLSFSGLGSGSMSNQNMSVYATNNGIRIYSIAFSEGISDGGKNTLAILANSTGGRYYYAPTGNDLAQIYTEIAGELKNEAGVNTTMDVIFDNVNVTGVKFAGTEVFDYVYKDGISTYIHNRTGNQDLYKDTIDQASQWNDGQNLHFDIGTIRLNQVWETTLRLKVKKEGNIEIFGSSSNIVFNNREDTLSLPATFVTAVQNLTNMGFASASLAVDFTEPTPSSGPFTDTIPLNWTITYNGTQNVHETLAYAYASLDRPPQWESFWSNTVGAGTPYDQTQMDVGDLPMGDYWFRVTAIADDAPEAVDTISAPVHIGNASGAFIKIG